jgi:hypothetical protein
MRGGDEAHLHPFDRPVQRREIDRDFIVECRVAADERHRKHALRGAPVIAWTNRRVTHDFTYDRFGLVPCQGESRGLASDLDVDQRECPLCGEKMRLRTRNDNDRVPGTQEARSKPVKEWVCPECDYFEEVEES